MRNIFLTSLVYDIINKIYGNNSNNIEDMAGIESLSVITPNNSYGNVYVINEDNFDQHIALRMMHPNDFYDFGYNHESCKYPAETFIDVVNCTNEKSIENMIINNFKEEIFLTMQFLTESETLPARGSTKSKHAYKIILMSYNPIKNKFKLYYKGDITYTPIFDIMAQYLQNSFSTLGTFSSSGLSTFLTTAMENLDTKDDLATIKKAWYNRIINVLTKKKLFTIINIDHFESSGNINSTTIDSLLHSCSLYIPIHYLLNCLVIKEQTEDNMYHIKAYYNNFEIINKFSYSKEELNEYFTNYFESDLELEFDQLSRLYEKFLFE